MILPETVLQDLRYGARTLRRNLGFTIMAALALALGIGVNTAVFTGYKAMVARPIDARDPGEMVNVALIRQSGAADFHFSYPDYAAYRDSLHSFRGLAASRDEWMTLSGAGGIISQRTSEAGSMLGRLGLLSSGVTNAEFASVYAVSENYFHVLGVTSLRGRSFESITITELIAAPSVLISENYWQRRFAKDPAVLGKTIRLNGTAVQIIGITPHDFIGTGIAVPDFWLPLSLEPLVHPDAKWLQDREYQCCRVFARLAPGATMNQVQAEMSIVADRLRTLHDPHSESAKLADALVWPGSPFPLPLKFYRGLRLTILLVMLAAAMLLLVACANVGSLQLARARSRQNELHTRLSLGASRLRIIRQLLTESVLLGLLAGMLALLFAWAFLQISVRLYSESVPAEFGTLIFNVNPDIQIFGYVLGVSLLAGILFGLAPALESSSSALSSGARGGTSSVRTRRLQDLLVAAQVGLSLVLMIAGSMLIRSSIHSLKMETGYDGKHVLDLNFQFPEGSKYTAARKLSVVRKLRTRVAALPGVAAITSARPPDGNGSFRTAAVALGEQKAPAKTAQSILFYTYVQPNYFATLEIPLFLGHGFESHGQAANSVIVSESAARQLWPGQNPVGRSVRLGAIDEWVHNTSELLADGPAYEVVGVARDTRGSSVRWKRLPSGLSAFARRVAPKPSNTHPYPVRSRAGHESPGAGDLLHRSRFARHFFHAPGHAPELCSIPQCYFCGRNCFQRRLTWASARLDGHLRHRQLYRRSAHPRSRHPHGGRRSKAGYPRTHFARKHAPCPGWIARRYVSSCRSLLPVAQCPLRSQYRRWHLLYRSLSFVLIHRTACRLPAVAASHARRSHGGAPIRVTVTITVKNELFLHPRATWTRRSPT